MKNKKTLSHIKVLIFDKERGAVNIENGKNIYADQIESESGLYDLAHSKVYHDEWNGDTYYLFNVDLPAKVEAANLKRLRRSAAISAMFSYDTKKSFDLFKFLPYVIIILMVMFGGK